MQGVLFIKKVLKVFYMALINYALKEFTCKIVYYGAPYSGKTTNLQYIHKFMDPSSRGDLISITTENERTLFFDFLPVGLGTINGYNLRISLYTVPGQAEYNEQRKIVLDGVDGIVFVVDSQIEKLHENIEAFKNMAFNLFQYNLDITQIPYVLQYNKRDLADSIDIEILQKRFNKLLHTPSFEAVATTGVGVIPTLKSVIRETIRNLYEKL